MSSQPRTYEWLTAHQHALKRPDALLGPVNRVEMTQHVFVRDDDDQVVAKRLVASASPALFKFFDEIVVNALDHAHSKIDIEVRNDGSFYVKNNGKTIPIDLFEDTGRYVIEILFVELMSGDSFDDTQRRTKGGRNGVGAALVNLFSSWMEVHVVSDGRSYHQRFESNLTSIHAPTIKKTREANHVSVTWFPEYARLGMAAEEVTGDLQRMLCMRAYDAAGCAPKISVSLNGRKIDFVKKLEDYAAVYCGSAGSVVTHDLLGSLDGEFCEYVLMEGLSPPLCVGFVNGVRTSSGTLVNALLRDLADIASKAVSKRVKRDVVFRGAQLKEHVSIVYRSTIYNPTFSSQLKDKLDTAESKLGFEVQVSKRCAIKFLASGVVGTLVESISRRDEKVVQKSVKTERGNLSVHPNYERATKLGGKTPCTLFVTEGLSAKGLAVAGFSVAGREHNGVFPLRGKLVNVHGMAPRQALENVEIRHLLQILRLDPSVVYDASNVDKISYRHLMIFVDQDDDGSHIMALLINVFHTFFPSLLRTLPDYLCRFATPIIRAVHQKAQHSFYSLPEYQAWAQDKAPTQIKYFKGLGTSSNADAKEYFSKMGEHTICLDYTDACPEAVDRFMAANKSDERKEMLKLVDFSQHVDYRQPRVRICDLFYKEVIRFSAADNRRSIPAMLDGLKPSQRKIVHTLTHHKRSEIKVAQLASATADVTNYHHGEEALAHTVVGMVQPWVGMNNLSLLTYQGQYGSRHAPKSAAAGRYIFTQLARVAFAVFPKSDHAVLDYLEEEGQKVEAKFMAPVVPMVLINGADGIGTGWRSFVPNFAPRDVLEATRRAVRGERVEELVPMYAGFKGRVYADPPGQRAVYAFEGLYEIVDDVLRITELPPTKWTNAYKEWLLKNFASDIVKLDDLSDDESVLLEIKFRADFLKSVATTPAAVVARFDLIKRFNTNNMVLFDVDGKLVRYETPTAILHDFVKHRLVYYQRRIDMMCEELRLRVAVAQSECRFIDANVTGDIDTKGMSKQRLREKLEADGYYPHRNFDYLLNIAIVNLTVDLREQRARELAAFERELAALEDVTPVALWLADLQSFEEALTEYERQRTVDMTRSSGKASASSATKKRAKRA